jgi:hypothetical protein
MPWHDIAALFFGGVFLANFAPHFVAGVSGRWFHSPFANPPFRGLSSPVVNLLWAFMNLAVAYALLVVVGSLELRRLAHVGAMGAGFALTSVAIASRVAKLQSGLP